MVDTLALGASAFGYEGSSPSSRTILIYQISFLTLLFNNLSGRGEMVDALP